MDTSSNAESLIIRWVEFPHDGTNCPLFLTWAYYCWEAPDAK